MDLTTTGSRTEFLPEVIKRRGFIRAKYWSWEEPRNGLITFANKDFLKVLFQTSVNAATSYYTVKISEVEAGLWRIIYTPDLEDFGVIGGDDSEDDFDLITAVKNLFKGEN